MENLTKRLLHMLVVLLLIFGLVGTPPVEGTIISEETELKILHPSDNAKWCIGTKAQIVFSISKEVNPFCIAFEIDDGNGGWDSLKEALKDKITDDFSIDFEKDTSTNTWIYRAQVKIDKEHAGNPRKIRIGFKDGVFTTKRVEKEFSIVIQSSPVLNEVAWIDNDPIGIRKPLILVHGIALGLDFIVEYHEVSSENAWNSLLINLEGTCNKYNFKPYIYMYDSNDTDSSIPNADSVELVASKLKDEIERLELENNDIHIIAHSMGGLVSRAFMNLNKFSSGTRCGDSVNRLITLFTPHHGTPVPNLPPIGLVTVRTDGKMSSFLADLGWQWIDEWKNPGTLTFHKNHSLAKINAEMKYNYKIIPYAGTNNNMKLGGFEISIKKWNEWWNEQYTPLHDWHFDVYDLVVPLVSARGDNLNFRSAIEHETDHVGGVEDLTIHELIKADLIRRMEESEPNPEVTTPSAPRQVVVSLNNDKPYLTWSTPSNDGGSNSLVYRVYRSQTSWNYSQANRLPGPNPQTYYHNISAENRVTYFYVVTTVNENNQESEYSNEVSIFVPSPPVEPQPPDTDKPFVKITKPNKPILYSRDTEIIECVCYNIPEGSTIYFYLVSKYSRDYCGMSKVVSGKAQDDLIVPEFPIGPSPEYWIEATCCDNLEIELDTRKFIISVKPMLSFKPMIIEPCGGCAVYSNQPKVSWTYNQKNMGNVDWFLVVCHDQPNVDTNHFNVFSGKTKKLHMKLDDKKLRINKKYYLKIAVKTLDGKMVWSNMVSFTFERMPCESNVTNFSQKSGSGYDIPIGGYTSSIGGIQLFVETSSKSNIQIEVYDNIDGYPDMKLPDPNSGLGEPVFRDEVNGRTRWGFVFDGFIYYKGTESYYWRARTWDEEKREYTCWRWANGNRYETGGPHFRYREIAENGFFFEGKRTNEIILELNEIVEIEAKSFLSWGSEIKSKDIYYRWRRDGCGKTLTYGNNKIIYQAPSEVTECIITVIAGGITNECKIITESQNKIPSKPQNLRLDYDHSQKNIQISWDQPKDNGEHEIINYVLAWCSDDETSIWESKDIGLNYSYTFQQPLAGQNYCFKVIAENSVGKGVPSDIVCLIVPEVCTIMNYGQEKVYEIYDRLNWGETTDYPNLVLRVLIEGKCKGIEFDITKIDDVYDNIPDYTADMVNNRKIAEYKFVVLSEGCYKWRARIIYTNGVKSKWFNAGPNDPDEVDYCYKKKK